jgi:hypothetical protein
MAVRLQTGLSSRKNSRFDPLIRGPPVDKIKKYRKKNSLSRFWIVLCIGVVDFLSGFSSGSRRMFSRNDGGENPAG